VFSWTPDCVRPPSTLAHFWFGLVIVTRITRRGGTHMKLSIPHVSICLTVYLGVYVCKWRQIMVMTHITLRVITCIYLSTHECMYVSKDRSWWWHISRASRSSDWKPSNSRACPSIFVLAHQFCSFVLVSCSSRQSTYADDPFVCAPFHMFNIHKCICIH